MENGKAENGIWKGGIWKDGWIHDIHKEGNFKPERESKLGYVRSHISPAEYWKDKKKESIV